MAGQQAHARLHATAPNMLLGDSMPVTLQVGDPETEWGLWARPEDQTAANDKPRPVHLVSSSRPGGAEDSRVRVVWCAQRVATCDLQGLLPFQQPGALSSMGKQQLLP
jgi:hypothetical protein